MMNVISLRICLLDDACEIWCEKTRVYSGVSDSCRSSTSRRRRRYRTHVNFLVRFFTMGIALAMLL